MGQYGQGKQVVFLIPEEQRIKILHLKVKDIMCLLSFRKMILGVWSAVGIEVSFAEHPLSLFETTAK